MGRILVFSLRTGRGLCGIFKQGIKKFLVSRSSWPLVGRVVRNGGECEWGRISRSRSVGSASASLVTVEMGEEWAVLRYTLAWGEGDESSEVI